MVHTVREILPLQGSISQPGGQHQKLRIGSLVYVTGTWLGLGKQDTAAQDWWKHQGKDLQARRVASLRMCAVC